MRVALHFHPDWPHGDGTVIEALVRDGAYRSQFETGTSNGGLTAHPGGDRWRWESRLFEGRYDERPAAERPVYGAVATGDPYGAAPRFGSAHLRLRAEVGGPERVGELLELCAAAGLDDLDRYVEAHVHGGVRLERDVEAIVLDPCFEDTAVHVAAARVGEVEWHPGYRLDTGAVDQDYRGPEPAALARALGPTLTPAVLGAAARTREHDPQTLKRVWHLLARSGR